MHLPVLEMSLRNLDPTLEVERRRKVIKSNDPHLHFFPGFILCQSRDFFSISPREPICAIHNGKWAVNCKLFAFFPLHVFLAKKASSKSHEMSL